MIVFVRLINEGPDVFRPVDARRLSGHVFEIIDHWEEQDEVWEFSCGDRVVCVDHIFPDGSQGLLAISDAPSLRAS